MRPDYILSLRQPTFSRWTAYHYKELYLACNESNLNWPIMQKVRSHFYGTWLRITHYTFIYQSWFYHTTSHYLCHKLCYHVCLVKIALGCSRNLKVYSRRFTSTKRLYIQPYHSMSDNSRFIFAIPSLHTHR
jgi:hypothetical protein